MHSVPNVRRSSVRKAGEICGRREVSSLFLRLNRNWSDCKREVINCLASWQVWNLSPHLFWDCEAVPVPSTIVESRVGGQCQVPEPWAVWRRVSPRSEHDVQCEIKRWRAWANCTNKFITLSVLYNPQLVYSCFVVMESLLTRVAEWGVHNGNVEPPLPEPRVQTLLHLPFVVLLNIILSFCVDDNSGPSGW